MVLSKCNKNIALRDFFSLRVSDALPQDMNNVSFPLDSFADDVQNYALAVDLSVKCRAVMTSQHSRSPMPVPRTLIPCRLDLCARVVT